MPPIELELERDGLLEMDLLGNFIGSAYSPQVDVTDTPTGHEVAITYMSPSGLVTERFDVADGEQGLQGPAGFSPTVTITDTPTGHTVTITDEDGPHSYDVPNYAQEEQQRQTAWDALSGEVTDAISDAETATSAASTAAQSATSAATSATSAAQAATTAAASANSAASAATSAATAANSAATAAGTAADAATTAAGDATDAAQAANTAAEAAQEAATELAPEVKWLWGNQLKNSLSGELMQASDAYAAPMLSLGVDGRSTQGGTPTPAAPVEIVSLEQVGLTFAGKNLFDKDNAILYNGYFDSEGHIRPNNNFRTVCIPVIGGTTYTISREWTTSAVVREYDVLPVAGETAGLAVHPFYGNTSMSLTTNAHAKCICISLGNITQIDYLAELATLQLELGSTATAYEPYEGHTVPLYDGTLRSLPDGTKDTLALTYLRPSTREGWAWYAPTLTRAVDTLDLGAQSWSRISSSSMLLQTERISTMPNIEGRTVVMCPVYAPQSSASALSDKHIKAQNNYNRIWVRDDAYNELTPADFKASLNGVYALYPLATPTTETLDPIELPVLPAPNCTVWADPTTGLQMEYVQDTNIVIAALEAAYADLATS